MDYDNFMENVCRYYRQPKYDDIEGQKIPNIQVAEAYKFVNTHIPESELAEYKERIFEYFEPTSTVCFPLVNDLIKIRNQMLNSRSNYYVPEYKTIEELEEKFKTEGTIKGDIDIKQFINDTSKLDARNMIKKYGLERCKKLWIAQGEYAYDNDIPTKEINDTIYSFNMLEKYLKREVV